MTEVLSRPIDALPEPPSAEKRRELVDYLVTSGEISEDFFNSGALARFTINPENGSDALVHIFLGDNEGGGHAPRISINSDISDVSYSQMIMRPNSQVHSAKQYNEMVKSSRRRYEGQEHLASSRISYVDYTDPVTGETKRKPKGSTLFPDDWSAERIMSSLLAVADNEALQTDRFVPPGHDSTTVKGVYEGLPITVYVGHNGEIYSGFPSDH